MKEQAFDNIQPELGDDELLIWYGAPQQGIVFEKADVFRIPLFLCMVGVALVWEYAAIFLVPHSETGGATLFLPVLGFLFLAFALYLAFGRFIHDAKRRSKMFYGITDQRVLIVSDGAFDRIRSADLASMSDLSLNEKRDKSGTICFGPDYPMQVIQHGSNRPNSPKFEQIAEAKEVYDLVIAQRSLVDRSLQHEM